MLRNLVVLGLVATLVVPVVGCSKSARESSQLYNQGVRAFERKETPAAYSFFSKALKLNPENALAMYQMALIDFYHREEFEKARRNLEDAKKLAPKDRDILLTLGRLKISKLDEAESGVADLDALIALDENYHRAWYWKAKGLTALSKYDEADAALRECAAIDPKYSRCFVELGALYEKFEQEMAAEAVYKEGLKHSPSNPDMLNAIGVLHMKNNRYAEAVESFRNVLMRDQTRFDALFNLAFGYSQLAKRTEGETDEQAGAKKKKNLRSAVGYLDKFIGLADKRDKENLRAARALKDALVVELSQD